MNYNVNVLELMVLRGSLKFILVQKCIVIHALKMNNK